MAYEYQENNNLELIETLENGGIISDRFVKNAMLLVNRKEFVTDECKDCAFNDRPLRLEDLGFNISAPHMYAVCLQALEIKKGNTFLDIGSGCGWMTSLGAFLAGETGYAHGIDILPGAVQFAAQNVEKLKGKGLPLQNVTFERRNVFIKDPKARKWDRIHVGAACSQKRKHILYELLNPGGVCVTPIGSHLIKAVKDMNGFTREYKLLDVRYSDLVTPSYEEIQEEEKNHIFVPVKSLSNDYCQMFNNPFLSDVSFKGNLAHCHYAYF
eukprot:TRINITY_DN1355_c0_g1_i1.p1 TRINITY_DN1355_c0_g1~~TRINITY_DN1355_c0_g1_i1.p1  ORF type:complete len:269 (-),score=58.21 TRINITY_DN1355_c0_g1_i1:565-1371(-)